ncbi:MAG: formate dehydrogenase subunit gamma [Rhodospirillales bacterium]|nr:formate dehydrogenase subunit gamma [Rhodospirillales bacterium]
MQKKLRRVVLAGCGLFGLVFLLYIGAVVTIGSLGFAQAQTEQAEPDAAAAAAGKSDVWRQIRGGFQGYVSIPDKQAGVLIQSGGESWRNFRNGPMSVWGGWAMLGMIAVLALFFALRGRIRIEHGPSGERIERFNLAERFAHWLTAVSFIVLALTGLNVLYGRYVLKPIIGPEAFAWLTQIGKFAHNYIAFAFMLGLILIFIMWVIHNTPNRQDLTWLAKGGGFFRKGVHPPARKFNAGQKLLFWVVILGGLSLSLSGIALMWPFEFHFFGATFGFLNIFGLGLPADLTPMAEMQLSQVWHGIVALLMVAVIIGHIYIGSVGMEGAFDAMGTGLVDKNWAREHHNLWVAEIEGRTRRQA